jgi:D-amino peptidase
MKVYISADIEGIVGISHWDEAEPEKPEAYLPFAERMTQQVTAACEGAVAAGAKEILVRDAHADARNLDASGMPECVQLVRGWSGHPLLMAQELDESFDAMTLIGYHSRAGSGGNPLAHTMSSSRITWLALNGAPVSEFHLFAWAGALFDVPVVFVSGDEALCEDVRALNPSIHRCPVLRGVGASTISLHPEVARRRIREGMEEALRGDLAACRLTLPDHFELEIRYREAARAYAKGFYPGARPADDHRVVFEADDYFEILRAVAFLV